jgi:hypothetical protein
MKLGRRNYDLEEFPKKKEKRRLDNEIHRSGKGKGERVRKVERSKDEIKRALKINEGAISRGRHVETQLRKKKTEE